MSVLNILYIADIYHCFCDRENDWGYSNFMAWKVRAQEYTVELC